MTRCKHRNGEFHAWEGLFHPQVIKGEVVTPKFDAAFQEFTYFCNDCGHGWEYKSAIKLKWLNKVYAKLEQALS
jgi:hypothetical protein